MKKILLLICIAPFLQSNAQDHLKILSDTSFMIDGKVYFVPNDTLYVPLGGKYKFVKIVDNVYKIASPSLQLVPNEPTFIEPIGRWENLPIYPKSRLLNLTPADTLSYGNGIKK